MIKGLLLRGTSSSQGTFGSLFLNNFHCFTSELPWNNNLANVSCIPVGTYLCKWKRSPKFGWCYHVEGVEGRGNVLIHPGNLAGSVEDGWKTHSHGCILPCSRLGKIDGQSAGLLSLPMVKKIAEINKRNSFILEIKNA